MLGIWTFFSLATSSSIALEMLPMLAAAFAPKLEKLLSTPVRAVEILPIASAKFWGPLLSNSPTP
jgi:hypothetical protein